MWSTPGGFCNVGEHPIDAAVREAWEETGVHIAVTGYLGVWVDAYADDPTDASADVINVAYYLAVPTRAQPGTIDPAEVHEARWFDWNDLPVGLAPPGTLEAVLAAARIVHREADGLTPVYDRPRGLM
jgi:ADP-ribose pyrophosphatase YjhB (NUDIX family)